MGFLEKKRKVDRVESLVIEADARMEQRLPEEAIPLYLHALEIDPDRADVWNRLGLAYDLMKDYQKALESLERSLQLEPGRADAWETKGHVLANLGRFSEAVECYDQSIQGNPENLAVLWVEKGIACISMHAMREAITCFDQALQIDPRSHDALVKKGTVLCQMGWYREALACFDRALELHPLLPKVRHYRTIALDQIDRIGGERQRQIHDFSES